MQKGKIKRIYLIGDVCSGKTTFIESIKDPKLKIVREDFWDNLTDEVKEDGFTRSMLFALYYSDRDTLNKNNNQISIFERHLEEEFIFADILYKVGKINKKKRDIIKNWTKKLSKKNPITNNDLFIIMNCKSKQLVDRLFKRSGKMTSYKDKEWDFIRERTIKCFSKYKNVKLLDTTDLTKIQTKKKVMEIINQYVK